jgi:Protein of unknown function (DUF3800)
MYVDESGDCGLTGSPTRYFVLSGLVVHELNWYDCLEKLIEFRRRIRDGFGLKLREELHAARLISKPGDLCRIPKSDRLTIVRIFANQLASMVDLRLINVVVDKQHKSPPFDVFDIAWTRLIQRFENTIRYKNFPGPGFQDERGAVFPDRTDEKKLTLMLRRMRRYNYVPNRGGTSGGFGPGSRNLIITKLVEDPNFRDSRASLFIQAADLAAFLLYQHIEPNSYMRKKGGRAYFNRLRPILCLEASRTDAHGIVWA